ncbi:MAG: hypothetical protein EPN85_05565 [Bacteroidetes bacterium]|nr:MAG: hypothetical protein EPN85_05565 [Bacteroidota bacterium]
MIKKFSIWILSITGLLPAFTSYALTDALKIRIENASYSDETIIRFLPGASAGFDACCDAWKLFPRNAAVPCVFTRSDVGQGLSINACPPFQGSYSVELFLHIGVGGTYKFSSTEPGAFGPGVSITMLDKVTGKTYNLRDTLAVHVVQLPGMAVTDTARFRIIFSTPAMLTDGSGFLPGIKFEQPDTRFSVSLEKNGSETPLTLDPFAQIISFNAKTAGGKVYLHWNVINLQQDGLFVIYASNDGENYHPVGSKKAIGTPVKKPIAYYFKEDKEYLGEKKYYRIVYLSAASRYLLSERISLGEEKASVAKISKDTE